MQEDDRSSLTFVENVEHGVVDRDTHGTPLPVVFFDGLCNLCNGTVRFALERDPAARLFFAPLQSELAQRTIGERARGDSLIVVDRSGIHGESDAAIVIASHLQAPWPLVAAVARKVPKRLRDAAYRFTARNRYRWFGKRESCALPRPEWRGRFLA